MAATLGDRIEVALDFAGMSVKDLEADLEKEGVEGGSYANLHRLKSNKMERPSAGLLYGIAKATGVRLPWLVADDGEMTRTRETFAHATRVGAVPAKMLLPVDYAARNTLVAAWTALVEPRRDELGDMEGDVGRTVSGEAWETLQDAVVTPLTALEDYVEAVEGEAFSDFVASVAMAVRRYTQQTRRES